MSRDFSRDGSLGDREPKSRSPAARVRIPTEKELSYSKELGEKELSRVLRTWRTKVEVTKRALADDADLILFQETRATLEVCMNDVAGAYDTCETCYLTKTKRKSCLAVSNCGVSSTKGILPR